MEDLPLHRGRSRTVSMLEAPFGQLSCPFEVDGKKAKVIAAMTIVLLTSSWQQTSTKNFKYECLKASTTRTIQEVNALLEAMPILFPRLQTGNGGLQDV